MPRKKLHKATLFECKSDITKEPIEVEWSDNPFKKIS